LGANYVVVYDEAKCAMCGKKYTLDKMFLWGYANIRVCKDCADELEKGGKK
jgi:ribosome-binding protein aMBF1 (putative translation factor)